jgi:universal stress protein A
MKPFTKILHPTDFSECADAALERAVDLRQRFSATLTLFHAYEVPVIYPDASVFTGDVIKALEDASRAQMARVKERADRFAREIAGDGRPPEIAIKQAMGSPWREIVEEAKAGHYDLIVMGTHGRTGLMHLVTGSVTERVVRMAPCPVLTLRGG